MFEDATGELWDLRLTLHGVGRLRRDGCLDLNALIRDGGSLHDWLSGSLVNVLRAGWLLAGRLRFTEWTERFDGEAANRLKVALVRAVLEFLPESSGDNETRGPEPDRRGEWIERIGWELAGLTGLGGDHTIRELAWAARERRRFEGELAAWHMANVVARIPFAGRPPEPGDVNPYRVVRAKSEKLRALEEWQMKAMARARAGLPVEPLKEPI